MLSKIISSWSLNGSIIGKFVWRSLKQINLINSTLEPEGEKLFIENILNYSAIDLLSKKFDLVFMHLLVPHKPYGFNKKCNYETKLSNLNIFMTKEEHILQHNIERNYRVYCSRCLFICPPLNFSENSIKRYVGRLRDHTFWCTNDFWVGHVVTPPQNVL